MIWLCRLGKIKNQNVEEGDNICKQNKTETPIKLKTKTKWPGNCYSETNVLKAFFPPISLTLSHMVATPILNSKTFSKSLPFSAYIPVLFISLLLLTLGPFQSERINPFSVFFTIITLASKILETNLSNTEFSLPGRGEEEAVNIYYYFVISHRRLLLMWSVLVPNFNISYLFLNHNHVLFNTHFLRLNLLKIITAQLSIWFTPIYICAACTIIF